MTTTEPTTWREYVDQLTAEQASRIGSLQRWLATTGPITPAEAAELAAIIRSAAGGVA